MKFSNQHKQEEASIELTPLIDVVFLLLIFFMISTTFTKEAHLKINLPQSEQNQKQEEQPDQLEIYIASDASYSIKGEQDKSAQSLINNDRDTLRRALSDYKTTKETLLVIRADKQAPHESVVKVMDVAQKLGLTRLTFKAEKSSTIVKQVDFESGPIFRRLIGYIVRHKAIFLFRDNRDDYHCTVAFLFCSIDQGYSRPGFY